MVPNFRRTSAANIALLDTKLILFRVGLLVGLILLSAPFVFAQSAAPALPVWQGRLHNTAGAPVANAKIHLAGAGQSATAETAEDGGFHVGPLATGAYKLTIEANGRTTEYAQTINLTPTPNSVSIEISDRGEIAVTVLNGQAATGGEALSSQAVSE